MKIEKLRNYTVKRLRKTYCPKLQAFPQMTVPKTHNQTNTIISCSNQGTVSPNTTTPTSSLHPRASTLTPPKAFFQYCKSNKSSSVSVSLLIVAAAAPSPKSSNPALRPPLAKCKEHVSRASVSATAKARRRSVFELIAEDEGRGEKSEAEVEGVVEEDL
jgi:hypothetical protein